MRHTSDAIDSDLGKLGDGKSRRVSTVAGSDMTSAMPKGANRSLGQVDMRNKVSPHHTDSRPNPAAPPTTGSTKPPVTWPRNSSRLESGLAKPTWRGPLPSREAPPR